MDGVRLVLIAVVCAGFVFLDVGLAASGRGSAVNRGIVWAQGDGIFGARPDGRGVNRIGGSGDSPGDPAWSSDGRRLAYTSVFSDSSLLHLLSPPGRDRILEWASGGGVRSDEARNPSWSPFGDRLAVRVGGSTRVAVVTAGAARRSRSSLSFRVTPGPSRCGGVIVSTIPRRGHRMGAESRSFVIHPPGRGSMSSEPMEKPYGH